MSETPSTESTEETEAQVSNEPTVKFEDLDIVSQTLVTELTALINKYNGNVNQLKSTDFQTAKETIYGDETNADMVKYAQAIEKLKSQIEDIETKRMAQARAMWEESRKNVSEDEATLKASVDADKVSIRDSIKFLTGRNADAVTLLPKVSGTRTASTGQGTGGRKLRGFIVSVDDEVKTQPNGKGEQVSSFSAAASALGIPTGELQKIYFEHVGTDNQDQFPATASFGYEDESGKVHKITAERVAS